MRFFHHQRPRQRTACAMAATILRSTCASTFAGRHHGPHGGFFGFGDHFGEDFGPGGRGGRRGFGPGRKLGSTDLQLLLLALLAEKPSHRYSRTPSRHSRTASTGYYRAQPRHGLPRPDLPLKVGHAGVEPEGAATQLSIARPKAGLQIPGRQSRCRRRLLAQLHGRSGVACRSSARAIPARIHWPPIPLDAGDPQPWMTMRCELQVARFDLKLALSTRGPCTTSR